MSDIDCIQNSWLVRNVINTITWTGGLFVHELHYHYSLSLIEFFLHTVQPVFQVLNNRLCVILSACPCLSLWLPEHIKFTVELPCLSSIQLHCTYLYIYKKKTSNALICFVIYRPLDMYGKICSIISISNHILDDKNTAFRLLRTCRSSFFTPKC